MKLVILCVIVLIAFALFGCVANAGEENNMANKTNSSVKATASAGAGAKAVKKGDTVQVDYVGTLKDGTVFDTSIESAAKKAGLPLRPSYEPLEFTVGAGQMIAGFDAGVVGMKEGETKKLELPPEQAYGNPNPQLVLEVTLEELKQAGLNVTVGSILQSQSGMAGKVTAIAHGNATIDFNHELAGKTLVFEVTLVKIK